MERYISVKDAANLTGLTREAIYQAIRKHGPALGDRFDGRWRVSAEGLARWRGRLPIAERPNRQHLIQLLRICADALERSADDLFEEGLARVMHELNSTLRAESYVEGATRVYAH